MTTKDERIVLWNSKEDKLFLLSVPVDRQYCYEKGIPCITVGIMYESASFKGYDEFTFFDHFYEELLQKIKAAYDNLNGEFQLYDMGADTDGYIDVTVKSSKLSIKGQLGASFSSHSLNFEFEADQTMLSPLMQSLTL